MIKDKLKDLRIKANLTQEELAAKIHVSRSAVCKWEMGNGIPSDVNIEGICNYFKVDEEWLLDRNDLKQYINNKRSLRKSTLIISIIGLVSSILFILLSFIGIFHFYCLENNCVTIAIYYPPKSIFSYLQIGVIIPLLIYIFTIVISFFNLINLIKEEYQRKLLIVNIIFIGVSLLFYLASFIIAYYLAKENGFVTFLEILIHLMKRGN